MVIQRRGSSLGLANILAQGDLMRSQHFLSQKVADTFH